MCQVSSILIKQDSLELVEERCTFCIEKDVSGIALSEVVFPGELDHKFFLLKFKGDGYFYLPRPAILNLIPEPKILTVDDCTNGNVLF